MKIKPLDIQQQKFKIRFRGFDIREVDEYLDRIADELGALEGKYERMEIENKRLLRERQDYRKGLSGEPRYSRKDQSRLQPHTGYD